MSVRFASTSNRELEEKIKLTKEEVYLYKIGEVSGDPDSFERKETDLEIMEEEHQRRVAEGIDIETEKSSSNSGSSSSGSSSSSSDSSSDDDSTSSGEENEERGEKQEQTEEERVPGEHDQVREGNSPDLNSGASSVHNSPSRSSNPPVEGTLELVERPTTSKSLGVTFAGAETVTYELRSEEVSPREEQEYVHNPLTKEALAARAMSPGNQLSRASYELGRPETPESEWTASIIEPIRRRVSTTFTEANIPEEGIDLEETAEFQYDGNDDLSRQRGPFSPPRKGRGIDGSFWTGDDRTETPESQWTASELDGPAVGPSRAHLRSAGADSSTFNDGLPDVEAASPIPSHHETVSSVGPQVIPIAPRKGRGIDGSFWTGDDRTETPESQWTPSELDNYSKSGSRINTSNTGAVSGQLPDAAAKNASFEVDFGDLFQANVQSAQEPTKSQQSDPDGIVGARAEDEDEELSPRSRQMRQSLVVIRRSSEAVLTKENEETWKEIHGDPGEEEEEDTPYPLSIQPVKERKIVPEVPVADFSSLDNPTDRSDVATEPVNHVNVDPQVLYDHVIEVEDKSGREYLEIQRAKEQKKMEEKLHVLQDLKGKGVKIDELGAEEEILVETLGESKEEVTMIRTEGDLDEWVDATVDEGHDNSKEQDEIQSTAGNEIEGEGDGEGATANSEETDRNAEELRFLFKQSVKKVALMNVFRGGRKDKKGNEIESATGPRLLRPTSYKKSSMDLAKEVAEEAKKPRLRGRLGSLFYLNEGKYNVSGKIEEEKEDSSDDDDNEYEKYVRTVRRRSQASVIREKMMQETSQLLSQEKEKLDIVQNNTISVQIKADRERDKKLGGYIDTEINGATADRPNTVYKAGISDENFAKTAKERDVKRRKQRRKEKAELRRERRRRKQEILSYSPEDVPPWLPLRIEELENMSDDSDVSSDVEIDPDDPIRDVHMESLPWGERASSTLWDALSKVITQTKAKVDVQQMFLHEFGEDEIAEIYYHIIEAKWEKDRKNAMNEDLEKTSSKKMNRLDKLLKKSKKTSQATMKSTNSFSKKGSMLMSKASVASMTSDIDDDFVEDTVDQRRIKMVHAVLQTMRMMYHNRAGTKNKSWNFRVLKPGELAAHNTAAIKVQRIYRGHIVRLKYKKILAFDKETSYWKAARTIQRVIMGHWGRRYVRLVHNFYMSRTYEIAAIIIQNAYRTHSSIRFYKYWLMDIKFERLYSAIAVLKKRHRVRRFVKRQKLREIDEEWEKLEELATVIQAGYRMHMQRRRYKQLLAIREREWHENTLRRRVEHWRITWFQRRYRALIQYRRNAREEARLVMKRERGDAVNAIWRKYRNYRQRCILLNLKHEMRVQAARKIQSCYRNHLGLKKRKIFIRYCEGIRFTRACKVLYTVVRSHILRKSFRNILTIRKNIAITQVQKVWRGHFIRMSLKKRMARREMRFYRRRANAIKALFMYFIALRRELRPQKPSLLKTWGVSMYTGTRMKYAAEISLDNMDTPRAQARQKVEKDTPIRNVGYLTGQRRSQRTLSHGKTRIDVPPGKFKLGVIQKYHNSNETRKPAKMTSHLMVSSSQASPPLVQPENTSWFVGEPKIPASLVDINDIRVKKKKDEDALLLQWSKKQFEEERKRLYRYKIKAAQSIRPKLRDETSIQVSVLSTALPQWEDIYAKPRIGGPVEGSGQKVTSSESGFQNLVLPAKVESEIQELVSNDLDITHELKPTFLRKTAVSIADEKERIKYIENRFQHRHKRLMKKRHKKVSQTMQSMTEDSVLKGNSLFDQIQPDHSRRSKEHYNRRETNYVYDMSQMAPRPILQGVSQAVIDRSWSGPIGGHMEDIVKKPYSNASVTAYDGRVSITPDGPKPIRPKHIESPQGGGTYPSLA